MTMRGAILRTCPTCDAGIGERCRIYKVNNGEREYILRHTKSLHAARKGH